MNNIIDIMLSAKDSKKARKIIRKNKYTRQTAGTINKYVQVNLCILPIKYTEDFSQFSKNNLKSHLMSKKCTASCKEVVHR